MGVIKIILLIVYVIVSIALIVLTLVQSSDESGASSTITGSSTNNFYNQNKGKTREGKMKKMTISLGVSFAVLAVLLSIFYI